VVASAPSAAEAPAKPPAAESGSGWALGPSTAITSVVFYMGEVADKVELFVGDEVEFVVAVNPKGDLTAKNVVRTKEAPKAAERSSWVRREVTQRQVTRYAKGPDGTRGFAVGRGRALVTEGGDEAI